MRSSTQNVSSDTFRDWLTARTGNLPDTPERKKALGRLQAQGLPGSKHEEYRFTPLTRAFEGLITDKAQELVNPITSTWPTIPGVAVQICFRDGRFILPGQFPTGVSAAISTEGYEHASKDAFALLNSCLNQQTLQITSDATEDVLIHIHHQLTQTFSAPTIAVRVNSGARLTVIESYDNSLQPSFVTHLLNAVVAAEGRLTWYSIQDFSDATNFVSNARLSVQSGGEATGFTINLGGSIVRNNPVFEMAGSGAVSNLFGLYLLNGRTIADNHTVVDHQVPNANSNELYKGIMSGQSRGVFNGKIFVRPDAQKTNAFQSNRNILLSDSATVNTKPQLEIWADDVKCSHGCTTGQLDEEALFYLRSRGIDRPSATALLLDAFAGEVINKLPHEEIRNLIHSRITDRLAQLT